MGYRIHLITVLDTQNSYNLRRNQRASFLSGLPLMGFLNAKILIIVVWSTCYFL